MMKTTTGRLGTVARGLVGGAAAVVVLAVRTAGDAAAHAERGPASPGGETTATALAIAVGLVAFGGLYVRGVSAIWNRAGMGRGVSRRRVAAMLTGLAVLAVALLSPLDTLSGELFAAHMVQHVLLILGAAPLLVLGAPLAPLTWAVPKSWRRPIGRAWHKFGMSSGDGLIAQPIVVGLIGAGVLWLWHSPSLYEMALASQPVHALEHVSFLVAALLFWWLVFPAGRRRPDHGPVLLLVFVAMLQSGALGALMTFARSPWYAAHTESAVAWGMTPLEDQQLAGTIMWVPMGTVYLLAALWVAASWLRSLERETPANETCPTQECANLRADGSPRVGDPLGRRGMA